MIKVDQNCNKLSDSQHPVNPAGFIIHSCIHAVHQEAGCVLHTHTRDGVAVSAQKEGVLPISQQSTFVLSSLAYHDYEGVAVREDEKPRLQADLGSATFFMLRNHGLLTVGKTVADAFWPCTSAKPRVRSRWPHTRAAGRWSGSMRASLKA
jgi:ribulose-5-phosphate 4-epimerase/fuculose-1-phosphate aldolase